MGTIMHSPRRAALLNEVRNASQLLRRAIERTGMTQAEAQVALGFAHKSDLSEALDGIRKLWSHQLLRPEAAAIRRELLVLSLIEEGICEVTRTIQIREAK
jgi:hypothetical protein